MAAIASPFIASFSRRLSAFLLDVVPLTLGVAWIAYQFPEFKEAFDRYFEDPQAEGVREKFLEKRNVVRNASALVYIFYAAVMNVTPLQGTFGKWCMRIKVVDSSARRLPFWQAMLREGSKMLSIIPAFVGCVASLFDPLRRSWHDKIAKTLVVKREAGRRQGEV